MLADLPRTTIQVAKNQQFTLTESGIYVFEMVQAGVELQVVGFFQAVGKEKKEVQVIIHHMVAHTKATTLLKGTADDSARVSFTGRIIIDPNCPDTNSFLTERILLLSDTAQAETVPDLEIESDDVKCSHSASISRIPEEHIFYLMSRGISRKESQAMIVEGFLA